MTHNKHTNIHYKLGFTMLELVFIIVILGILASLALPRMERDVTQEAADSILSDIRYTQHLALLDDMHEYNKPKWQQKYWRIVFASCDSSKRHYYMVGSDTSMDDASNAFFARTEAAVDPATGFPMFGDAALCLTDGDTNTSKRMYITKKYNITAVTSANGCNGAKHIAFDHFGRPHHGVGFSKSTIPDHNGYMTTACVFTFTFENGKSFQISIQPETGYAQIVGQPNS